MCKFNPCVLVNNFSQKISKNSSREVVLLTGASSGLGLAIAKNIIQTNRYVLVVTARETSISKFYSENIEQSPYVLIRSLDVRSDKQIHDIVDEINGKFGGVDILINNAGIADRSTVEESNLMFRQAQLDVNYLAPFEIISQVLSLMRKKGKGKIINISSAGGFMAMPTMSSYSASKFALEGASESLWYEMKPWGVHVTLVIPGFIKSEGFSHTTENDKCKLSMKDIKGNYHEHYIGMKSFIRMRMKKSHDSNEMIASRVLHIMKMNSPPLRAYVTFDARLLFMLRKILPAILYMYIMYRLLPDIDKWGKQPYKL